MNAPIQQLRAINTEYLAADKMDKNSPIKFRVKGNEILPNKRIKVMDENKGMDSETPLKYLIILE